MIKIDRPMRYLNWHGKEMGRCVSGQTMVNMYQQNGLVTCMQMLMLSMMLANISFIL